MVCVSAPAHNGYGGTFGASDKPGIVNAKCACQLGRALYPLPLSVFVSTFCS